ncbi:MFS transporter [Atopobium fossor]|uniref:MFS transporter n=1 Tax=Atopobium fossor TaxID=39487 RepID=UPI0004023BA3|nr:MFS transporter [Atopobium fossor]
MIKNNLKTLVGVYSCALSLMALIVPVPVLAGIAQAFPGTPITSIQLVVTLPSLIAIPVGILVSKLASRVYKKYTALFFTAFYIFAGTMPIYLHGSITELLVSAALVGVALGGLQNAMTTIIPDYFEGESRGAVLGLLSTFVCLGGFIYTAAATTFGAQDWTHAFYAYFIVGIFFILELICLPKGKLEPKATKNEHVTVPSQVIVLCIFMFLLYTFCQLFNSNEALLVAERGLGATAEAGMASSAYTISGIVAGLIVAPLIKAFKKHSPTATFVCAFAGLACYALAQNIMMLCIAGFFIGLAYQTFTPFGGMGAANFSGAMGMAFNMALCNAAGSLGQALSPFTTSFLGGLVGGSITNMIWIGVVAMGILSIAAYVYFGKNDITKSPTAESASVVEA